MNGGRRTSHPKQLFQRAEDQVQLAKRFGLQCFSAIDEDKTDPPAGLSRD